MATGCRIPPRRVTAPVALGAGQSFRFVVRAIVPAIVPNDGYDRLEVSAQSVTPGGPARVTNEDTAAIFIDAPPPPPDDGLTIFKAFTLNEGPSPSDEFGVVIRYSNSNLPSSGKRDFMIMDRLPDALAYVPGSARWSGTGAAPLTDPAGGDPAGVAYDFGGTTPGTALAVIPVLGPGDKGELTFRVRVVPGREPGEVISNVAALPLDGSAGTADALDGHAPRRLSRDRHHRPHPHGRSRRLRRTGLHGVLRERAHEPGQHRGDVQRDLRGEHFPAGYALLAVPGGRRDAPCGHERRRHPRFRFPRAGPVASHRREGDASRDDRPGRVRGPEDGAVRSHPCRDAPPRATWWLPWACAAVPNSRRTTSRRAPTVGTSPTPTTSRTAATARNRCGWSWVSSPTAGPAGFRARSSTIRPPAAPRSRACSIPPTRRWSKAGPRSLRRGRGFAFSWTFLRRRSPLPRRRWRRRLSRRTSRRSPSRARRAGRSRSSTRRRSTTRTRPSPRRTCCATSPTRPTACPPSGPSSAARRGCARMRPRATRRPTPWKRARSSSPGPTASAKR